MNNFFRSGIFFVAGLLALNASARSPYLSPTSIKVKPGSGMVCVLLSTANSIAVVDGADERLTETIPLGFTPGDFCFSADGKNMYVTEYTADGKLHAYTGKSGKPIAVGAYPAAVCVNTSGTRAWVANRFSNDLSVIDLEKGREIVRIPMIREPKSLALSPDGKTLAVGNFLPGGTSLDDVVSSRITLVDTEKSDVIDHLFLNDGTQSLEDVCFSNDGNYIFATHLLSRYQFPTTHLERGWMNTNALSVVDVKGRKHIASVLLDDMYAGAANPCGLAVTDQRLFVAISGTHDLMALDIPLTLRRLEASMPVVDPANDLLFLKDAKQRVDLPGKGARRVAIYGGKAFVTDYFSGGVSVVDIIDDPSPRFIKLGDEPEADDVRKGEIYFSDAELCFQQWQSCVSCHPEGRTDGLNWDLMNDGMGNPKNSKSLLYSHVTPPNMITGIRADAETAVRAGIRHIQFAERPEKDAVCIDEYLKSMRPLPSPYLVKNKLSKNAQRGKMLYEKAGCAVCHNGDYYTDGKKYDVGTGMEEYTGFAFDTPALNEVWRTSPYLYNGGAETIKDVLTIFNKDDKHGKTSSLTDEEIGALEEYILSL